MDEVIRGILEWALSTEWAPYVTVVLAVVGAVAKVVAVLPISVTEKLPDWFMTGLNYIAFNFGNATKTDMKGNRLEESSDEKLSRSVG